MEITISKNEIGSRQHLSYDGSSWSWVKNPSDTSMLWGFSSPRDLRSAAISLNEDIVSILDTPWGKAHTSIGGDLNNIPWRFCMPKSSWSDFVKNLVDRLWCEEERDTQPCTAQYRSYPHRGFEKRS
jgi:hypothetical protein